MADRFMQRLANGGRTGVFLAVLVIILVALSLPGWGGAIVVTAIVGVAAFAAAWVPANRASRVDPMTALRHE